MTTIREYVLKFRHGGLLEIAANIERELNEKEEASEQDKKLIEAIVARNAELRQMTEAPNHYAAFSSVIHGKRQRRNPETGLMEPELARVEVVDEGSGRYYSVYAENSVNVRALKRGQRLRVTAEFHVLEALEEFAETGAVGTIENIFPDHRVIVRTSLDETSVLYVAENIAIQDLAVGRRALYDGATRFVYAVLPQERESALKMEVIKAVTYDQIGGLEEQIREFENHIVLPRLAPEVYAKYRARLPKGAVFYGPPGCGKTLLARAAAYRAQTMGKKVELFIGSGPEFLDKWVGESEHKVREPAEYAKAHPDIFVLYVVDEIDAIVRTRGSAGGHGGVNDSVVTQFNTILDGFIEIPNLIFIGITNRLDLIDSSILRPGRLDLHLKIPRPDRASAEKILRIYLDGVPTHQKYSDPAHAEYDAGAYAAFEGKPERVVEHLTARTLDHIYGEGDVQTKRQEVAHIEFVETSERQMLTMRDFVSGALLENIANEAKLAAGRLEQSGGEGGIRLKSLHSQTDVVFRKLRDQINRSHSQEWARMADLPVDRPFRVLSVAESDEKDAPKNGFSGVA